MNPVLLRRQIEMSICVCAIGAVVVSSFAQSPAPAKTLEIPTLVVDHEHRPVDDVHAEQFRVKVDAQDEFAPLSLHMQDKEPLTLSILIDASRDSYRDLSQMGDDLASITSTMFLPDDRLTIYALDCSLARSLYNETPTPDLVRKSIAGALGHPKLHDHDHSPACGKDVHLWDNVAAAVATLSKLPGRRVLLLVSSGHDGGSKYDWKMVSQYAQEKNVAIFGLRDQRQADADDFTRGGLSTQHSYGATVIATRNPSPEARDANNYELLCANAGGLILNALPLHRNETLAYLLFILRHRLILTIPAAAYPAGTSHNLKVTIPRTPYFVSAAGVGEPQPTP